MRVSQVKCSVICWTDSIGDDNTWQEWVRPATNACHHLISYQWSPGWPLIIPIIFIHHVKLLVMDNNLSNLSHKIHPRPSLSVCRITDHNFLGGDEQRHHSELRRLWPAVHQITLDCRKFLKKHCRLTKWLCWHDVVLRACWEWTVAWLRSWELLIICLKYK